MGMQWQVGVGWEEAPRGGGHKQLKKNMQLNPRSCERHALGSSTAARVRRCTSCTTPRAGWCVHVRQLQSGLSLRQPSGPFGVVPARSHLPVPRERQGKPLLGFIRALRSRVTSVAIGGVNMDLLLRCHANNTTRVNACSDRESVLIQACALFKNKTKHRPPVKSGFRPAAQMKCTLEHISGSVH